MQNRYTGDIGDFGKIGLLRYFEREFTPGVNWYLTPDETHNGDGRHIGYLQKDEFRLCDQQLWTELRQIVDLDKRQVSELERPEILQAKFYRQMLDFRGIPKNEREVQRWEWHTMAMQKLRGCDIVFVDPDNGLMVPSADGTSKGNKFVLPFELAEYYRAGASVIYYQHKARRPDEFYVAQNHQLVESGAFPGAVGVGLKFKTTSQRYYFFLIQPRHTAMIERAIGRMMTSPWGKHFEQL